MEEEMDISSHASSDHSASTTARSNTPKYRPDTHCDTSKTDEAIVSLGTMLTTTDQDASPNNAISLPRKSAEIEALDKQLASFPDPIMSPNLSEKIRIQAAAGKERNHIQRVELFGKFASDQNITPFPSTTSKHTDKDETLRGKTLLEEIKTLEDQLKKFQAPLDKQLQQIMQENIDPTDDADNTPHNIPMQSQNGAARSERLTCPLHFEGPNPVRDNPRRPHSFYDTKTSHYSDYFPSC